MRGEADKSNRRAIGCEGREMMTKGEMMNRKREEKTEGKEKDMTRRER